LNTEGIRGPIFYGILDKVFGDPDQIVAISRHDRLGWYFKQQANIIFGGHGANVSAMWRKIATISTLICLRVQVPEASRQSQEARQSQDHQSFERAIHRSDIGFKKIFRPERAQAKSRVPQRQKRVTVDRIEYIRRGGFVRGDRPVAMLETRTCFL
jgi:hypothetical protein